jgi:hypothetical protein
VSGVGIFCLGVHGESICVAVMHGVDMHSRECTAWACMAWGVRYGLGRGKNVKVVL